MNRLSLLFVSLAFVAAGQIVPASAATSTLTVSLAAQNGSGESGTATLTQQGANVQVVIAIKGAPATTPQPAHIHNGTCSDLGGVAYSLTSLVNGASTTLVKGVTIDDLIKGTKAINVHESAADLGKYVACGNITAPSSM